MTAGIDDLEIISFERPADAPVAQLLNEGISRAKHDIVVFVHDDIEFDNTGWAKLLYERFLSSNFGILGVSGTTHLDSNGGWLKDTRKAAGRVGFYSNNERFEIRYSSIFQNNVLAVCCIEGAFFACHKKRIVHRFDERYPGKEFYDIDFSFANHIAGVPTGVMFDVSITHLAVAEKKGEDWKQHRNIFLNKFISDAEGKPILSYDLKPEIIIGLAASVPARQPKVEVIIPNKDNVQLLESCIRSILGKSSYSNLKITVADTGSDQSNFSQIKELCQREKLKLVEFSSYHFAKTNNDVVKDYLDSDTELLLFCNNDIELINDAISALVATYLANEKSCGTVGARLHFADNSVQHFGIELVGARKQDGSIDVSVMHKGYGSSYGYALEDDTDVAGNTAAFMLISRELFTEIGMFNEAYKECMEDLELNLQCILHGRKNITVANAVAYHYESQTRENTGHILPDDFLRVIDVIRQNIQLHSYIRV